GGLPRDTAGEAAALARRVEAALAYRGLVDKKIGARGAWGGLSKIEEGDASIACAIVECESAAQKSARCRMDDSEREHRGCGGVGGIPTFGEDLGTCERSVGMIGCDAIFFKTFREIARLGLGGERQRQNHENERKCGNCPLHGLHLAENQARLLPLAHAFSLCDGSGGDDSP